MQPYPPPKKEKASTSILKPRMETNAFVHLFHCNCLPVIRQDDNIRFLRSDVGDTNIKYAILTEEAGRCVFRNLQTLDHSVHH